MPVMNILCSICTEVFINSDDIYATTCGHIFHHNCMRDWVDRASSCPQCRTSNPPTHKLYLSFDDSNESTTEIDELKVKVESLTEKIQNLYEQIHEGDVNFLHLQEQYTTSEELTRELKENIRQSNDSENNFLHLQAQYTKSEALVKELQEKVQLLQIENEFNSNELALKSTETSVEAIECSASEVILKDKIKILEQKLKHLSAEFEKEISNSTQLAIDKMKLQSYIDRHIHNDKNSMHTQEKNKSVDNAALSDTKGKRLVKSYTKERAKSGNVKNYSLGQENNNVDHSTVPDLTNRQNENDIIRSVVIRQFALNQISYPLENIIIDLAAKMDLSISKDDLSKVNIMENNRQRQLPKKVTLHVQFKSLDLKKRFLSNKNRLRNNPTTTLLIIKEYIDDLTNSVFVYANQKLRGNGFEHVFCSNNRVIAKKCRSDPVGIRIFNRCQVDDMLNNLNTTFKAPKVSPTLYEDKIDECFYKI